MGSGKKLYLIAGEASGDLHGSNLMKSILKEDKNVDFRFWGGDKMISVQDNCVKHIRDLAFMGFWEVFTNIRTILGNIRFCKEDILKYKPDAIVLIDYPGFNLRIAEWAKENGIKVYFYISPQVWAWKQSRVHKIKKVVDHMFVILPFEKAFYAKFDYEVEYVGHPLLDEINDFKERAMDIDSFRTKYSLNEKPIIAILPGSRNQEIHRKLPIMLESVKGIDSHQVVIAGAPNYDETFYSQFIKSKEVRIIMNDTYNLLLQADLAVVTSGTATLETALFDVPLVVCYKGSRLSYEIAKRLVKIDYISLVNLILDKPAVKELIQDECTSENIREEINLIMNSSKYREDMEKNFANLKEILGGGGASEKVAQSLLKTI